MDDFSELYTFVKWVLICAIVYMIFGPVGVACTALIALIKVAKKRGKSI